VPDLTHQTVRLAPGRHRGPEDGVCVMELASMLAGEPFTDRPRSVCPVIAAFLRSYNDGVDNDHRKDLYRFASEAVGTRAPEADRLRSALCRQWIHAHHRDLSRGALRLVPASWRLLGTGFGDPPIGTLAGTMAAKLVRKNRPGAHEAALAFVDRLIECSAPLGSAPHGGRPPMATVLEA
jgi:hypothetical protein